MTSGADSYIVVIRVADQSVWVSAMCPILSYVNLWIRGNWKRYCPVTVPGRGISRHSGRPADISHREYVALSFLLLSQACLC